MKLENKTQRMLVFVLPHETYCEAHGECACAVVDADRDVRVASSLTLPVGDGPVEVPEAALMVREIAQAVRREEVVFT
jgi:hypothetical protein